MQECVKDLCHLLKNEPALYQRQFHSDGFEWIDLNHRSDGIIVFKRKGEKAKDDLLVILNMTPTVHLDWKVHVRGKDSWREIFNSNDQKYWGTGDVFNPFPEIKILDKKHKLYEINVHLPALSAVILK